MSNAVPSSSISSSTAKQEKAVTDGINALNENRPICNMCQNKMNVCKGESVYFWGCSIFPKCYGRRWFTKEENIEEENTTDINKLLIDLENDIYYLQEFYPNDRNAFLFLDIYANEIAELLGLMKMYDALILLSNYDADNSSIYNSFIK